MRELSDYGAGVDHDPGPEDEIRLKLSKWLRSAGADVFWDQDRNYGWNAFDVSTQSRPDLLVKGINSNYIIEVKPAGESSSNLHDGVPQLVNYWERYEAGDMQFSIRGKGVDIDGFLLATDFSPQGRLYTGNGERDVMRKFIDKNRKAAINSGQLPEREFNATESIIRVMWRFSKERNPDAKTGIGALLSSRLDGTDAGVDNSNPAALYKSHGGIQLTESNTGYQFWDYIPFNAKPNN